MAVQLSLPALLDTLTSSLTSAHEATPKLSSLAGGPTPDGVSLLDVKNELLLSYLQNLVFLILLKIRRARSRGQRNKEEDNDDDKNLSDTVVEKLVELRLYLEHGVRPLEEKLRFQLDKILRAADDADRNAEMTKQQADAEAAASSSDDDDNSDSDDGEDKATGAKPPSFAHNPAFQQAGVALNFRAPSKNMAGMAAAAAPDADRTGVYRPPKINPTAMPTTDNFREARRARGPLKSATMDEYIREELSAAPTAQPSVGTNVEKFGRSVKTAKQRDEEARRREYEESNFVRLPQESKADRAKRKKAEGGARANKMQFGGEDWHDLGEGAARIDRLTARKGGRSGGSTKELLDRSRKRGRDVTDSARGSGHSEGVREMGEHFQKRLKIMEGGRRDRGKR